MNKQDLKELNRDIKDANELLSRVVSAMNVFPSDNNYYREYVLTVCNNTMREALKMAARDIRNAIILWSKDLPIQDEETEPSKTNEELPF